MSQFLTAIAPTRVGAQTKFRTWGKLAWVSVVAGMMGVMGGCLDIRNTESNNTNTAEVLKKETKLTPFPKNKAEFDDLCLNGRMGFPRSPGCISWGFEVAPGIFEITYIAKGMSPEEVKKTLFEKGYYLAGYDSSVDHGSPPGTCSSWLYEESYLKVVKLNDEEFLHSLFARYFPKSESFPCVFEATDSTQFRVFKHKRLSDFNGVQIHLDEELKLLDTELASEVVTKLELDGWKRTSADFDYETCELYNEDTFLDGPYLGLPKKTFGMNFEKIINGNVPTKVYLTVNWDVECSNPDNPKFVAIKNMRIK